MWLGPRGLHGHRRLAHCTFPWPKARIDAHRPSDDSNEGAAQAIEDGGALAVWLGAGGDVADASRRYEEARLPRVSRLQAMSRANKVRFHMPDGPDQQARDAEWALASDRAPDALRWLYAYDRAVLEQSTV